MKDIVLDIKNLRVQFQSDEKVVQAVNDISFQVKRGQTLGIVGESGSGKSVTSLAIMGLLSPDTSQVSGEILFRFSNNLNESQPHSELINLLQLSPQEKQQFRGGQIAMVFQEPMSSLNPVYTIGFQLTEAIKQHEDVSPRQAMWKATSLLQEVKLLPSDEELLARVEAELAATDTPNNTLKTAKEQRNDRRDLMGYVNAQKRAMLDRYPHELSGGQLQRVMIAIAISCNPTLLIADEPTTALDVTVQATILDLLRELCSRRGMSMIFITHDLGVIAEIADTVAVMYRGKIVESGSIRSIFLTPQHPYTKGLLACRPPLDIKVERLPTISDFMEVETGATGELEIREKNTEMNEIQGLNSPPQERQASTTALLSVEHLRVGFKVSGMFGETKRLFMAVNDVSFQVYQGETLGLVGESGCGKSTLARALLQLIPVVSGKVIFDGENITKIYSQASVFDKIKNYNKQKEYDQKRQKLRREMQIVFQDPFSSLDPRMTIGDTIMEPMLIHGVGKNGKERRDRAAYLLERVEMKPDWMGRYPHEFSGGQRQRVCIARSLALNPKFIICDESVSALDVSVQAQVLNLLKELQAEFGLTYIFISHDLSVVKFISDRIMVMNRGKIEEIGQAEDIYQRPQTEYTRQLIASIPTGDIKQLAS
ncbi:ABC transporter ATP-binding protein [Capilliphycus salinus ALCB114379]|uniref:ABC transporter ATP-binding protein n=1 Tax=Capilliphycus salinus TaxID=2768948 RepID=UPI0039A50ED8